MNDVQHIIKNCVDNGKKTLYLVNMNLSVFRSI